MDLKLKLGRKLFFRPTTFLFLNISNIHFLQQDETKTI